MNLTARELDLNTYSDFEALAAKQGSCWCMYYQRPGPLKGARTRAEAKRINRRDKRRLVREGSAHAALVYDEDRPVGWCQYGLADELPRIDAGRGYKKVGRDEGRLWRITCFFVDPDYREKGVAKFALHAALNSIESKGGGTVEAYPVVSAKMARVPEWRWFGTPSMFLAEGFKKTAPLGTSLMLMRMKVNPRTKDVGRPT